MVSLVLAGKLILHMHSKDFPTSSSRPTVTVLAWQRVMALNIIYAHLTTI